MASTLHATTNNVDDIQPALNTSQQFKEQSSEQQQNAFANDLNVTINTQNADNNTNNSITHAGDENIIKTLTTTATAIDVATNNTQQITLPTSPTNAALTSGLGISLMQSSPPPHSYRHSRAYRHFKNPPQPHMCIRTITESGEEIFINVLSWTRIVIPQEPSDPIPLYGGMRVPPGSPRSPPIVFAVMANPEVLKDSGRHSKDAEERRAMVELMCDFVEAMNPGIKLVRNAVILKDRDISGELKDVWNAVQAQRDREREEQILQQRQQQHYHNITTQQMFPKTNEGANATEAAVATAANSSSPAHRPTQDIANNAAAAAIANEMMEIHENGVLPLTTTATPTTLAAAQQLDNEATTVQYIVKLHNDNNIAAHHNEEHDVNAIENARNIAQNMNVDEDANGVVVVGGGRSMKYQQHKNLVPGNDQIDAKTNATRNGDDDANYNVADAVDIAVDIDKKIKCNVAATNMKNQTTNATQDVVVDKQGNQQQQQTANFRKITNNKNANNDAAYTTTKTGTNDNSHLATSTTATTANTITTTTTIPAPTPAPAPSPVSAPTPTPAPTKKEKLGGFLPNGCIFPRFKNNKHKDKDKEKDKDKDKDKETTKTKDKEKTLLNALKKSKDKKVAPMEQHDKPTLTAATTTTTMHADAKTTATQYEKNCMNLESEVQKLDLNKMDINTNNDNNMFIKLKVAATAAAATTTTAAK